MKNVTVIGGGQAGLQICESLRREGYGGEISLISDEGYLPYHRPPLSKAFLLREINEERLPIRPESFYEKQNISCRRNVRVLGVNRANKSIELSDGPPVFYEKLAIATGARVRTLPLAVNDNKIFYVRSLGDAKRLAEELPSLSRVGVIGGGFIGLEAAAVCRTLGKEVILFEQAETLMARVVPEDLASFYEGYHKDKGVRVELNTLIKGVSESNNSISIATDTKVIDVDALIVGIGAIPNVELAKKAGLDCENGILTNSAGQTSDESIFAAGDCAAVYSGYFKKHIRLESVQHAVDTGKVVGASMLGKGQNYSAVPWFWSDQYNLKLQIAGALAPYDDMYLLGEMRDCSFSTFYFFEGRHVGTASVNRPSDHMKSRKILANGSMLKKSDMEKAGFDFASFVKKNN